MNSFSGDGVLKLEDLGVQEISSLAWEPGKIFNGLAGVAVERIAYEGMADGCKVNSDLMRAA